MQKVLAHELQKHGRFGDTMLAHISPDEAELLKEHGGAGTINPTTGLPEYFSLGRLFRSIAPIALPILGSLVAPGLGTALGSTLGGAALSGIGGAVGGGIGGSLNGGGLGGALKGAALGGGGGYLANGGFSELFPETSAYLGNATGGLIGNGAAGASGAANPTANSFSSLFGSGSSNPINLGSGQISTPSGSGAFSASGAGLAGGSPSFTPTASPASLAMPTTGTGVGGGGSSFGSLFGGNGLGTLATVGGAVNSMYANNQAQKDLVGAGNKANAALAPYTASGAAANSKLSDLLGTSGNASASGYGTLGQPFTPGDLTQDPGYQFQLQQGDQALQRQQAAAGTTGSGAAMKAAEDYGQGLAGTTYNNAYQRYLQGQQQQYGMLAGQGGQGASAANAAGNIFGNIGSAQAGAEIGSSGVLGQSLSSLLSGSGQKQPYLMANGQVGYR